MDKAERRVATVGITLAAALWFTSVHAARNLSITCVWPSCFLSGDLTVTGTLTADTFDSPAKLNDGGSIVLRECEAGTGCPAAGAGNTVTLLLPSNENPLDENKSFLLSGYQHSVIFSSADWSLQDDVDGCLQIDIATAGAVVACGENAGYKIGGSFAEGLRIDKCLVDLHGIAGWDNVGGADLALFRIVVWDTENNSLAEYETTELHLKDPTTGCGGITETCKVMTTAADESFYWPVDITSTVDHGWWAIKLADESNDQDGDAVLQVSFKCRYL
jgi:hypothetical protein